MNVGPIAGGLLVLVGILVMATANVGDGPGGCVATGLAKLVGVCAFAMGMYVLVVGTRVVIG